MNEKPNLFQFATSELSQDAVLAYMLAWADPKHAETTKLHKLGQNFLLALLDKVGQKMKIDKVVVDNQDNNIDISVDINEKIFMIIEDKVDTMRHGDQIPRYKEAAKKRFESDGKNREVVAVYLKTGNESKWFHPAPERASCFFRCDLLKVLNDHKHTNNSIIDEFRTHLQGWEDDTRSFEAREVSKWCDRARQGYYIHLEKRLIELGLVCENYGWCYTNNPRGGFLEFWWGPGPLNEAAERVCHFGLQIRNCEALFIRANEVWENKQQVPVSSDIRWQLYERIAHVADRFKENVKVTYSGRAGGWSATIARIDFDGDEKSGRVVTKDDMLDFDASVERIRKAIQFLDDVREKVRI